MQQRNVRESLPISGDIPAIPDGVYLDVDQYVTVRKGEVFSLAGAKQLPRDIFSLKRVETLEAMRLCPQYFVILIEEANHENERLRARVEKLNGMCAVLQESGSLVADLIAANNPAGNKALMHALSIWRRVTELSQSTCLKE